MKKAILTSLVLSAAFIANAQYKNDDVLFKTVETAELCQALRENPGHILLDVRSKGEHEDTSFSVSLNIGRLRDAVNIPVQELGSRLHELDAYKNKPIFIYCSHSQRSRRASKMLADSGFVKVYNVNGGLTALHASSDDCLDQLMVSNKAYSVLSAAEVCRLIEEKKDNIFLLDVRSDSAWNNLSRFEKENAIGSIKGAAHIARANLVTNLAQIPRDKHIILTDLTGVESAFSAILLNKLGYANISVMIEGMDRLLMTDEKELPCKTTLYQTQAPYGIMNAIEFGRYVQQAKNFTILDVRTAEEFSNSHKDQFRNIGHIVNAVNIPLAEFDAKKKDLDALKNKPVVVYSFSSGPESFTAARRLFDAGFRNVTVLMGGIFNIRWTAANRKDQADLKNLVTDVPDINQ